MRGGLGLAASASPPERFSSGCLRVLVDSRNELRLREERAARRLQAFKNARALGAMLESNALYCMQAISSGSRDCFHND